MKKIFVTLFVLLVAFAVVMPAAAGGNEPGTGTGQPGTCVCADPANTGNSYGPGEPGTCCTGDPANTGNSYGPGEPGTTCDGDPALIGNQYRYGPGEPGAANGTPVVAGTANTLSLQSRIGSPVFAPASAALTEAESAGLLFMVEEEKMARDVYQAMYTRWGEAIFKNIAASEQTHMDAVRTLLVRYGIPVPQTAAGVFKDASLQSLYDQLVASGSQSLVNALQAGVSIEQEDIADLQSHLAETTRLDIQRVYTNLLNASNNHLASFTRLLASLGS